MLLNIGKWLPRVDNDTPVMNTPGILNSPVVNTPGSLSSLVVNTLGNLDFPVMFIPVSRLLGVLWTSTRTGLQKNFLVTISSGVKTPRCIHHRRVLPTWCILPRNNFRSVKYSWSYSGRQKYSARQKYSVSAYFWKIPALKIKFFNFYFSVL